MYSSPQPASDTMAAESLSALPPAIPFSVNPELYSEKSGLLENYLEIKTHSSFNVLENEVIIWVPSHLYTANVNMSIHESHHL